MIVAARLAHPEAGHEGGDVALDRWPQPFLVSGERGEQVFLTHCASCHQIDGSGMKDLAAPLRGSRRVQGHPNNLIRILLHGFQGKMLMPSHGTLTDEEIAAVLSHIRNQWGNGADAVSAETVTRLRATSDRRARPWTEEDLSGVDVEEK